VPTRFLLVSREEETAWPLTLSQALKSLGEVELVSEEKAVERVARCRGDAVVIVDATVVEKILDLIARLREQRPQARIVVATASPTWRRARDVLRLGAVDYIPKSLNKEELLADMKSILGRYPPTSSN